MTSFTIIDQLPKLFPLLTSLRTSNNPFTKATQSHTKDVHDTVFYLTLARIPNLKTLNYTTITARDREEGEIYYLVSAEKAWTSKRPSTASPESQRASFDQEFRRYADLCTKYDRESIFTENVRSRFKVATNR